METAKKIEIIGVCILYYLILYIIHLFSYYMIFGVFGSINDSLYVLTVRGVLAIFLTILTYMRPPKSPNIFTT